MNVLVVDVGGSKVKILFSGDEEARRFPSGRRLTPQQMVAKVKQLAADWKYDAVSIGYPGFVLRGRAVADPHNLAVGWVGFDFRAAFGCPVKLINDAAMQALGSYKGGKMLFLGLGTGLGAAMIVDGIIEPMELAHLPYKKATFEDYVGQRGLDRKGKKKWREHVVDVVARLVAALEPDDVVLGGGNVKQLNKLPPGCRAGDNANAFLGGFRLWEEPGGHKTIGLAEADRDLGRSEGTAMPLVSTVSQRTTEVSNMKPTEKLHELGQSLWLDNITRDLLTSGTLERYIDELSVTGLTSNPTIFDRAIKNSTAYDAAIRKSLREGKSGEQLFLELALADIRQAADRFRPIWERTSGVDGWVSLEVSPLLAHDTARSLAAAQDLHARAARPNVLIKIPGTQEGLPAIEEAIFAGVPVNVTLLFSREHYVAAAEAFLRGIERRIDAGLKADVGSVASVFVSRWDGAVMDKVPDALRNRLGIAVAQRAYTAYGTLLASPRWQRAFNAGARPQRLLWGSTGTKDPNASDVLYVNALAAPFTVNTMPEATLNAFAEHGDVGAILPADGGDSETVLTEFAKVGVDVDALAARLQDDGATSFVKSWNELMAVIASKSAELAVAMRDTVSGN